MISKKLINNFLKTFQVEMHGFGYMQSLRKHSNPPDAFSFKRKNIKESKIIFDVGANRGDTVQKYLEIFPTSSIYAFEPFPELFKSLEARFIASANVNCYSLAISNKNDFLTFYSNHNPDTNSLLKPQKIGLNSDKQVANIDIIKVESISIDSFCSANNINKIDILKMDIQGGELQGLKGAETLLSSKNIALIYIETYFRAQYESQPLFHDISLYLAKFGYYLQDIYSPIYGNGSIAWCDAVFLPEG